MPIGVPAAIGISSLIGAGSSIAGSLIGSSASKNAAAQQVAAQQKVIDNTNAAVGQGKDLISGGTAGANQTLSDAVQAQLAMYAPYIQQAPGALTSIQQLAGAGGPLDQQFSFNPTDLQSDPGYQFTLQQGQQAIQRAAAAKGGLFSTGTMKSLAGYTTGTADQYFNDAYTRALNTFNTNRQTALSRIGTLQGLANLGFSGTQGASAATGTGASEIARNTYGAGTTEANLGMQGADIIGRALGAQGNAQAAGTVGSANSINAGIGGVANSLNQGLITQFLLNRGVFGSSTSNNNGSYLSSGAPGYNTNLGAPTPYTGVTTNPDGSITVH